MYATFLSLRERCLHDLLGDPFDLDIHLQGSYAFGGASNFEIHVAQMVFVAQDIGQYGETTAFLDQSHGDARHMRRDRHTRIHQCQTATAN